MEIWIQGKFGEPLVLIFIGRPLVAPGRGRFIRLFFVLL